MENQNAILARDRAVPNITANVWFYAQFLVSMLLKREDLVPWADQSRARRLARRIIEDKWFNRFVMTMVFVNIVAMTMYHADMSRGFSTALEVSHAITIVAKICHDNCQFYNAVAVVLGNSIGGEPALALSVVTEEEGFYKL